MVDDDSHDGPDRGLRGWDLVGLGGLLLGGVVGGLVVGLLLDNALGTDPVFALIGVFLGIALGATGFIVRVRRALRG